MGLPMAEHAAPLLHPQSQQPSIGIPIQEPHPPSTYILLPYRSRRRRRCFPSLVSSSTVLTLSAVLLILATSAFILFPSDPHVSVSRLSLHGIHISPPSLTLSLSLYLRIRNPDFFSLDYKSMVVSIGYRGKRLGFVNLDEGRIRARGVSYVDAEMVLDGVRVAGDLFYLLEDVARGVVPFDTISEVDGTLHVFFLDIPVEGRISCTVNVNPRNQSVVRQDCFPE